MTQQLNDKVNECALTLSGGKLLAKLSGGDVVAQKLKYHPACLEALYNRKRAYLKAIGQEHSEESSCSKEAYPLAFSELLIYINESKNNRESPVTFRLAYLTKIYKERLEQLGMESPNVHSNRLKDQLIAQMPELESHKKGRDLLLAFKKDIGPVISQVYQYLALFYLKVCSMPSPSLSLAGSSIMGKAFIALKSGTLVATLV